MNIKHIYYFSRYNIQGISTRYRGLYILKEIKKNNGINYSFIYPSYQPKIIIQFLKIFLEILFARKQNSLIVFQKLHTNRIYTNLLKVLLKIKNKNTIYDTDDADYLRYKKENIHFFMQHANYCTVGSNALFSYVGKRNKKVKLLSSPIIKHTEIKQKRNKKLHIGWIGDYGNNEKKLFEFSHKFSLTKIIYPILKEFDFPFKLSIIGIRNHSDKIEIQNYFKQYKNIELNLPENLNWLDEINIYKKIKEFDIGLSPLINHEFNIAKSAFKAKQCLSCGVPVLASPVGENNTVIKNGFNGFICETPQEFKQKILLLKEMKETEYLNLIKNARQSSSEYSIKKYCENFIHFFENA